MPRAVVIINSQSTNAKADLSSGIDILEKAGIVAEIETCDEPERLCERLAERNRAIDMVIVGGGDGTLNRAAEAICDCERPVGILPMGNANDLARTLRIPKDLEGAFRVIAEGRRHRIDLGRVNGKLFFNVAGIGISVEIARHMTTGMKRRYGVAGYPLKVREAFHRARPFRARIRCNGSTHRLRAIQISVGNGRFYGGGMSIVDDAAIDDQRLDLYGLQPLPLWKLLLRFPLIWGGKHRTVDDVLLLHGRAFEIETSRLLPINVDGEIIAETPARFEVVPAAIEVFVPADYR